MSLRILNNRDSRGTGYVLAIVGVAAALVVVIVGASTLAALNRGVPKELWAIGGALSGALVGILAPPPRTRTSGKEEAPLSVGRETLAAANEAARGLAQHEDYAGQAVAQGAERGLHAVTQLGEESKAALEALPDDDPVLVGGSPRAAGQRVVASFARALAGVGTPLQGAPTDHVLDAERAVHEAAIQGAQDQAAVQHTEPGDGEAARTAAIAVIDGALASAQEQANSRAEEGLHMGERALAAVEDVAASGQQAYRDLLTVVPLGQAEAAGARPAQHAAVTILSAQQARLNAQPTPADKADQAAANVHEAAVAAAAKVADAAAPTEDGWLSGLKTILIEPKIIVPLLLFAVTAGLGILLGLGVIHVSSVCEPTMTPAKESLCSRYGASASQASNVLISLAAATVGALVGIFAGHPGEQQNPSAPTGG